MADANVIDSAKSVSNDRAATPEALVSAMRATLDTRKPWYYTAGHSILRGAGSLFGSDVGRDEFDGYMDQINWFDSWQKSKYQGMDNDAKQKLLALGHKLLDAIINQQPANLSTLSPDILTYADETILQPTKAFVVNTATGIASLAKDAATGVKDTLTPSTSTLLAVGGVALIAVIIATRGTRI